MGRPVRPCGMRVQVALAGRCRLGVRWGPRRGQEVAGQAGAVSSWYWSSSTNVNNPTNAWNVNFNNGNVNDNDKTNDNYVRAVRRGT